MRFCFVCPPPNSVHYPIFYPTVLFRERLKPPTLHLFCVDDSVIGSHHIFILPSLIFASVYKLAFIVVQLTVHVTRTNNRWKWAS